MVRFLEDPEEYKTCEMIEHIDSSIQRYEWYLDCKDYSNNIWMFVIQLQNHETVKEADNNGWVYGMWPPLSVQGMMIYLEVNCLMKSYRAGFCWL